MSYRETALPGGNVERLFNEGTLPRGVCGGVVEVKETNEAGDEQGWVTSLGPDARQRRLIEEPGG